ncbi:MAG TPA: hypothetical protein VFI27_01580 [candidate division Zixibacteria bacterium]|nr:hypothetical protein [candidate division Zixibacteria bacterium]
MGAENQNIPAWAHLERERDFEWIDENVEIFCAAATSSFEVSGRGAIVVDTTTQPSPDAGHPFGYLSQNQLEQDGDEDTKRMLSQYDPSRELVLLLLKPEYRTSSYRIRADRWVILRDGQGAD